jgi:galactoside O-acetyltransferase
MRNPFKDTFRLLRELRTRIFAKKVYGRITIEAGVTISGYENIVFGENVTIGKHSQLYAKSGPIRLGDNVSIGRNVTLGAGAGEIVIGNNVLIAQNVVMRAGDHGFSRLDIPIREQATVGGVIHIGNDCWIGANSVITRNVAIGNHSVIGAGSVVTKDVAPYSVVAGNPAKLIRDRKHGGEKWQIILPIAI